LSDKKSGEEVPIQV